MINLENFVGTEKQQAVINKYGWNTIERLVNRAWFNYWNVIKEVLDNTNTYSNITARYLNTQNSLLIAVLDYIYQNDNQLKIKFNDVDKE